jgi:hypothetical protein
MITKKTPFQIKQVSTGVNKDSYKKARQQHR